MLRVTVSVPAHLHAGNYELSKGFARLLGTVGVTVSWPRTTVEAWKCRGVRVEGPYSSLAAEFLERLEARNVCVRIVEAVSRGVGLGGTTALALSVSVAARALNGPVDLDLVKAVAARLGRGWWSALGLYSFLYGGFIVDSGRWGNELPKLIARLPIPHHWRIVVVVLEDHVGRIRGLKEGEERVLENLPKAPEQLSSTLSRLVLSGALACLAERRLRCFIQSLHEYNAMLGEYWASLGQGGRYCCSEADELVEDMRGRGYFFVQSSWGPALWTIVADDSEAERLLRSVRTWAEEKGVSVWAWYTQPDNTGAVTVPGHLEGWRKGYG